MAEAFWVDVNGHEGIWVDNHSHQGFWNDVQPVNYGPTVFPPAGPSTLQNVLPAYLYNEYNDDPNVQAFVTAYNQIAQNYVTWFAQNPLGVYTNLSGPLLDWVAQGLYGISRPSLPSNATTRRAALDTFAFNTFPINGSKNSTYANYYVTNDDTFKRIITWAFYKGDGKVFNIRWLKRRIMRFLFGGNGVDYGVDQTYRVSVSVSGYNCTINISHSYTTRQGGSIFNTSAFNTTPFDKVKTKTIYYPSITEAPILKAAIAAGALELPFQITFTVNA